MDFVEHGFRRFACANGADTAKSIWSGELRIADYPFNLSEPERNRMEADAKQTLGRLFLIAEYDSSALIPIGATVELLAREHSELPRAFYRIFVQNLWKWMRVYDFTDALEDATMWLDELDENDEACAHHRKVREFITGRFGSYSKMSEKAAKTLLRASLARVRQPIAGQLIQDALDLDRIGREYEHNWLAKLEQDFPEISEFLGECDGCCPGALVCWHEGDDIHACCDDEIQNMGQNGPLEPALAILIPLLETANEADQPVRRVLDYAATLLQSLARAAKIVERIQEIDDECTRQRRLQPGLPTEPGPTGVWNQQL